MRALILSFVCGAVVVVGFWTAPAAADPLKKVVAVSRFENQTSFVDPSSGSSGQALLTNGLADQLTDALIQSGRYIVLERQTLTDVIGEQDLATSGRVQQAQSARTGKLTAAQILIKGTVTEFGLRSEGSDTGIGFGGFRLGGGSQEAHVAVIIRMIDTTTGQVLASQRVEGTAESSGSSIGFEIGGFGFDNDNFKNAPLGKATQIVIDKAVDYIGRESAGMPFRAPVIMVREGRIMVGAGGQHGTQVGDRFAIFSTGEELVDPFTGEILGVDEQRLGSVTVTQVQDRFSTVEPDTPMPALKVGDVARQQ